MERKVLVKTLARLGIPAAIKGYNYIMTSINMLMEDEELINSVTKRLYPAVAKVHDTTSSRVERAIRHAIEVGSDNTPPELLEEFFGHTYSIYTGRLTNAQFLSALLQYFKCIEESSAASEEKETKNQTSSRLCYICGRLENPAADTIDREDAWFCGECRQRLKKLLY